MIQHDHVRWMANYRTCPSRIRLQDVLTSPAREASAKVGPVPDHGDGGLESGTVWVIEAVEDSNGVGMVVRAYSAVLDFCGQESVGAKQE